MPTVGYDTLKKLRSLYATAWHKSWPYDNAYLCELWLEARKATDSNGRTPSPNAWIVCLDLMKEST